MWERINKWVQGQKQATRWDTVKILVVGFLGVILVGAILLWLPISNQEPMEFMDALFTSVTCICVTGLITITPATQLTVFGKVVMLILIQIGGLGVIACVAIFFFLMKKRISMKERIVIQESYSGDRLGGVVAMIRKVIIGTFVVEGIGAIGYALDFVPRYGFLKGILYAIFHSVSAFCNAGIDILGDNSLANYVGNPIINITTAAMIIMGGLGFIVWYDFLNNIRNVINKKVPRRWWFTRLTLHSKLVLVMTAFLLVSGTVLIFLMESGNPDTMGGLSLGQKWMAAFFQSVTTRTAGFYSITQSCLHEETKFLCCILMFIGGSQGGTAGGVKTITVALLALTCLTAIRGGRDIECFGRKIPNDEVRTGLTIVFVSMTALFVGVMAILIMEPDSIKFIDILYEATSAVATVGLTADLTPHLCRGSQIVLMLLMYIGRVGPVTLALLFVGKSDPKDHIRRLPEERIVIG